MICPSIINCLDEDKLFDTHLWQLSGYDDDDDDDYYYYYREGILS